MLHKNWNYTERKINFQNAQGCFNNLDNQFDNQFFNLKASSFCNPSEYHINKQMMFYNTPDNGPSVNMPQSSTFNNIEKFFSPNLEKTGDKKKSKKEIYPLENQYVIYLENVITISRRY
jgi:hypothetical protein